ncbi:MAG: NAD(P)H-binding protein [Acidimicrobiia bacterium]|nr:NAD(P)H-binding protein [Acidimicrobiia bacterium]
MEVLVTGGTGVLGSAVVAELVSRVHAVRVLTRHPEAVADTARVVPGSLASTGAVAEALDGVDAVVHCATDPRKHRQVDNDGTAALLETALRSGNPHVLYPGIVGSDVIPLGYYKSKVAAEEMIEASACPHTVLRATQFHTLIWDALDRMVRFPVMVIPRDTRFQPFDHAVMARLLADAVESGPRGRMADLGGPMAYEAKDLATSHRAATGHGRRMIQFNLPGIIGAALRAGGNLTPNRTSDGKTWNDFVAERMAESRSQG